MDRLTSLRPSFRQRDGPSDAFCHERLRSNFALRGHVPSDQCLRSGNLAAGRALRETNFAIWLVLCNPPVPCNAAAACSLSSHEMNARLEIKFCAKLCRSMWPACQTVFTSVNYKPYLDKNSYHVSHCHFLVPFSPGIISLCYHKALEASEIEHKTST